jgi:phosphatidylinositol alpha-1,6-mannosyltransferase
VLTVRFFGNIPDEELAAVYDRSDIFALTSVEHGQSVEGFGLVYLEAAAHSLPIVAHRVGGVSEAVRDGVTGLLVTPGPAGRAGRRVREADPRRPPAQEARRRRPRLGLP